MSPKERSQWWKMLHSDVWSERDGTIESILDRVEQLERELAAAREVEHIDEGFKLALARAYSRVEDLKSVLRKALKYFDDLEHGIDQGTQWPWALRNEISDVLLLKQESPVGHS